MVEAFSGELAEFEAVGAVALATEYGVSALAGAGAELVGGFGLTPVEFFGLESSFFFEGWAILASDGEDAFLEEWAAGAGADDAGFVHGG